MTSQWHQFAAYFTLVGPVVMILAAVWLVRWSVR